MQIRFQFWRKIKILELFRIKGRNSAYLEELKFRQNILI